MCDTILAPPNSTVNGALLFGKNSDRQRNEAQVLEQCPRADYEEGAQLACTYIAISQVRRTHAVVLCRPFWIWGAEMGANEHGVVIGNEAVHARVPASKDKALIGMDLLRLALERASTASEAVEVITSLLEQYGQGGNCGHLTPSYYQNGFMVADPREAFVLETVGREWLVERVRGVHAISNTYSIGQNPERTSRDLSTLIRSSTESAEAPRHFAQAIVDPLKEHIGNAKGRRATSMALLSRADGHLGTPDFMAVLRDHGSGDRRHPEWLPEYSQRRTVCMHAGSEDLAGQTVGSMVSEVNPEGAVHWVTATAAPCIGIFKPVLMNVPLPPYGPQPSDRFDSRTLWWRHERLHRAVIFGNFPEFIERIRPDRDALEAEFGARIAQVLDGGSLDDRVKVVAECWREAMRMEDSWHALIGTASAPLDPSYRSAWNKMNDRAGIGSLERPPDGRSA